MARFPFEFELTNTYMHEDNKLVFLYKVRNTGDTNMPFGIGGHPAFKVDEDDVKQIYLLGIASLMVSCQSKEARYPSYF